MISYSGAEHVDHSFVVVDAAVGEDQQASSIRCAMSAGHVDYYEFNEAFAVVNLHAERELGVSREACNLYGGGISIVHPPGATGVQMALTAMRHMELTGDRTAIVSMCLDAVQCVALLIEAV